MGVPLVLCDACNCHVRIDEARCPHCGSARASHPPLDEGPALDAPRSPARTGAAARGPEGALYRTRRAAFAVALAGLGAACGGQVAGGDGHVQQAAEADIVGTCDSAPPGTVCTNSFTSTLPDGGVGCECGLASYCAGPEVPQAMKGGCVPEQCAPGSYLSATGCAPMYWYTGPNGPTVGGCYGAPPLPA
jgi:hypothetical protein